jgi:ribosomal protein L16/L10AE
MNTGVRIPQGDDMVKVELTVKEAMALAGAKFPNNHNIEVSARKKLNSVLEDHYIEDNRSLN